MSHLLSSIQYNPTIRIFTRRLMLLKDNSNQFISVEEVVFIGK